MIKTVECSQNCSCQHGRTVGPPILVASAEIGQSNSRFNVVLRHGTVLKTKENVAVMSVLFIALSAAHEKIVAMKADEDTVEYKYRRRQYQNGGRSNLRLSAIKS